MRHSVLNAITDLNEAAVIRASPVLAALTIRSEALIFQRI